MKTLSQYIKESLNIYEEDSYYDINGVPNEAHKDFDTEALFNLKKGDTIYLLDRELYFSKVNELPTDLTVYAYKVTDNIEFNKLSWYDDYKTSKKENDDAANYYKNIEISVQKIDNEAPDFKSVHVGHFGNYTKWTEDKLKKYKTLKEKLFYNFDESRTLYYSITGGSSLNGKDKGITLFLNEKDYEKTVEAANKLIRNEIEKHDKKAAERHARNIQLQKKNAAKYGKEYDGMVKNETPEKIIKITAENLYKYYEYISDPDESSWDNDDMHCTLKGDIDELFKDLCEKNKNEVIEVAMYDDYVDEGYRWIKYSFMIGKEKFLIFKILRRSPYDYYYAMPLHQFMKENKIKTIK